MIFTRPPVVPAHEILRHVPPDEEPDLPHQDKRYGGGRPPSVPRGTPCPCGCASPIYLRGMCRSLYNQQAYQRRKARLADTAGL